MTAGTGAGAGADGGAAARVPEQGHRPRPTAISGAGWPQPHHADPPNASDPAAGGEPGWSRHAGFDESGRRQPDNTDVPADATEDTPTHHWYDDEAGPLVRLYALTRGRARPVREVFDLIALIAARERPGAREVFGPEHTAVLNLCAAAKRSVADLAADCDLPVGVIRVILSDLLEVGCVEVTRPSPPASLPDQRVLQEVIDGLRAL